MTDETIFATALEKSDPAERSAYLDSACGDDLERRARVVGLLAALGRAGGFLEQPAVAAAEVDPESAPTRPFNAPGADPGDGPTRTSAGDSPTDAGDLGFLAPAQRPDSIGRIGHYEVLEVLGRGGFGIVFRAFDEVLQRVVAVKVLAPAMAATSPARKRFIREAQSSAKVRHENVVTVHDVKEQPLPYLVMEFVPGETLQHRLDRTGPLEVAEVVRVARQIAEGLAAAHAQGLIHRDIKPSNILIESTAQQRAKITDFGLARAADDASLTRSGVVAGTPMYMAPEQAKGETLDHRADLFSLGSVMYAILTGHPPFRASTTMAVLKRVCEEDPRPIREVIPEVPEWLCRIVEKLHAKNPTDRFQTAREVADLLADCERQLQAHKELKDTSRIPEAKAVPAPRRSRLRRVAVTIALLAVIGAALAVVTFKSAIYRYAGNRAEVEFTTSADPDVEKLLIRRNGELVATLDRTNRRTVLAPGEYEVEAVCIDGYEATKFHVDAVGLRSASGSFERVEGRPAIKLTVRRGDAATIAATAEKRAPPPSPEAEVIAKLKGDWFVRFVEVGGKPTAVNESETLEIRFGDREFELRGPSIARGIATGTFQVEPASKQLVLHFKDTLIPVRCSYRAENDVLQLRFDSSEGKVMADVPDLLHLRNQLQTANSLKLIGVALDNYSQAHGRLPPAALTNPVNKDGKALLSWRVAILPFIEHDELHKQFKLEESWDSEHNKKLIAKMPKVFAPFGSIPSSGLTPFRVFVGPGTMFEPRATGVRIDDVPDGPANTVLVAEAADPVIWTKPDELPFVPNQSLANLGWPELGIRAAMCDTTVVTFVPNAPVQALRALITRNGNETVVAPISKPDPSNSPPVTVTCSRNRLVPLYNGKDLADWKPVQHTAGDDPGRAFEAHGDILVVKGRPSGFLLSKFDLNKPFELRYQWRGTTSDPRPVHQLHFHEVNTPSPFPNGVEVVISPHEATVVLPTKTGEIRDIKSVRSGNEWQDVTILSDSNFVRVSVNGLRVVEARYSGSGPCRVVLESVNANEAHFRKIEIKELPPSPPAAPPPAAVAPFDAVKAKEHQEAWAKHLGVLVEYENPIGMKFRLIPAGEFAMGSSPKEIEALLNHPEFRKQPWLRNWILGEGPERRVKVAEPFYMGVHEMTVGQFRQFVAAKKYKTVGEKNGGGLAWNPKDKTWAHAASHVWNDAEFADSESHPVGFMTLADAQAFCAWLSEQDGLKYVVPTEVQWEFACRAGTTTRWSFGDGSEEMKQHGWTAPHADNKYRPVGRLAANPFGLFDLHGNVCELALDAKGAAAERGGRVETSALEARSATRWSTPNPNRVVRPLGFRVAIVGDLKARPPIAKKEPNPAVVQALRDAVAAKGRTVADVKLRFEAGTVSKLDLLAAQVELRDAQIKLAEAEADEPILILHLRELVKLREEESDLVGVRVKAGIEREDALNRADARLAEAKARLAKVKPPEVAPEPRPAPNK